MTPIVSIWPLAAILISLLGALPILLSGRQPNLRESWTIVIALVKLTIVASLLPWILEGGSYVFTIAQVIPGVPIELRVDALGMIFALVASCLWLFTSIYSIGYMRALNEHAQTRYFASFAVAISATLGIAFAGNLLTLYLFYEVLSLSTYPLVTHHQNAEARSSGRKYLTYILGTSIGLALPAMLITYSVAGTLDFTTGGILAGKASPELLALLVVLFLFGFAKAGLMPFHGWLPAAMVAPTPVSSFLHGVAVVKAGVFAIFRVIFHILGPETLQTANLGSLITYIAAITVLVASLIALTQDSLKRRLAFGKITLFFCAGAIYVTSKKKNISQMNGLGKRMPITYLAFFLGSLSIIGMPPLGGFISKWNLLIGAVEGDQLVLIVVLLVSSLLNAAYFFPVFYRGFFMPSPDGEGEGIKEAPLFCLIPLSVTALVSLALFFFPDTLLQLARMALGTW
jgi:multicomponent Na+:H+ antiporter subunit D